MDRQLKKKEFYKKLFPKKFPRLNPAKLKFVAKMIEKKYLDDDRLYCLPPDRVIQVGQPVDDQQSMVLPSQVLEHFIRKSSHRFIMDTCICRESMPCQNYPHDIGCIFLGQPTRDIHPGLGREATVDETIAHTRRALEAGLVFSVGKSKLDTVWLEIGPGDKLFTICMCCPCCCITRGIVHGHPMLGEKYQRMPGVEVAVTDDCAGCGTCTEEGVCIFGAISLEDGRAKINDNCRGCSRCVQACPNQAIQVRVQDNLFVDQTIARLSEKIDVT